MDSADVPRGEDGHAGGDVDASPIYLSETFPSSAKQLGLSFAGDAATSSVLSPATAPPASPSFRVHSIHLDDVAKDVILVCEEGITLMVPLSSSAPAHGHAMHSTQDSASAPPSMGHLRDSPTAGGVPLSFPSCPSPSAAAPSRSTPPCTNTTTAAVCLRMPSSFQVWTSSLSSTGCATSSSSGFCLPRRLPTPPQKLHRSPGVLVAVPLPSTEAMSSSMPSTVQVEASRPASGSSRVPEESRCTAPSPVMCVCIMDCPVLPDGVDCIEAAAIPFARPLANIVCAPNTLRFREAWYPIHFFSWCDHGTSTASSGSAMQAPLPYTDHHLLCASSISVDLVRVRCGAATGLKQCHSASPLASTKLSSSRFLTGDHAREERNTSVSASHTPSGPSLSSVTAPSRTCTTLLASLATARGQHCGSPILLISLLQRYVTHSDWCTYDARSRVLLSLNRSRPFVVKPIEVYARQGMPTAHQRRMAEVRRSDEAHSSTVELRTWAELTLPEGVCAAFHFHDDIGACPLAGVAAANSSEMRLPFLKCPQTPQQMASVLGVLTVYGYTFVYHVSSCAGSIAGQRIPVVNLYMHRPSEGCAKRTSLGVSETDGALSSAASSVDMPASDRKRSSNQSVLKRLTAVAALATASAPPPCICDGTFVHVAQLSLAAVTSPESCMSPEMIREPSPDHVGSDTCGLPLPQLPSTTRLCIQVVDNLILVHVPNTAQSAAYDLADLDSGSVPQEEVAAAPSEAKRSTKTRGNPLEALAFDPSRVWRRSSDSAAVSATPTAAALVHCFSEPTLVSREAGCASSPSSRTASSSFWGVQGSRLHNNNDSGAADDTDSASTAVSRSLLSLSQAACHLPTAAGDALQASATGAVVAGQPRCHRERARGASVQHQAPSADFASMMSVLATSVLRFVERNNASAFAATPAAPAAPWVYPLCCCRPTIMTETSRMRNAGPRVDSGNDAVPVSCTHYQWWVSSQVPLVMGTLDGGLYMCRINATRMAESRLIRGANVRNLRADEGRDRVARDVRSYVCFLCRRHAAFFSCPCAGPGGGSLQAVVVALRELTVHIVGLTLEEGHVNTAGISQTETGERAGPDGLRSLLRGVVASASSTADGQLYAVWRSMIESLTVESCLYAQCKDLERWRSLALEEEEGSASGACTCSFEASGTLPWSSAEMQRLILDSIFRCTWSSLVSSSSLPYNSQRPQEWQQKRIRLEGLLCDYVQLLRVKGIPVAPQLQRLLLEVVVGDVGDTSASSRGFPASTRICSAARRLGELLRQKTLEPNAATARRLLSWWRTQQDARASSRLIEAAKSRACFVSAKESSAVHSTPSLPSAAVTSASSSPAAAVPTVHHGTDMSPCLCCSDDSSEELDILFEEAIRLLEVHGYLLEVAEAHSWRSDFTAAAAVLQCARQQGVSNEVPGVEPVSATSHCQQTRVLSWDSIALSVLDGAWRQLCLAEEGLFSYTGGLPSRFKHQPPQQQTPGSEVGFTAPKSWQLRSLEGSVLMARRIYSAVAATLLVRPAVDTWPLVSASEVTRSRTSSPTESWESVEGRYDMHEISYAQLCRHMEQDWHALHPRGGV